MAKQDSFFIELGTMTTAYKAQKFLGQNGIESEVGKVSSGNRGCSYGIHVKGRSRHEVTVLLRASSFKIL